MQKSIIVNSLSDLESAARELLNSSKGKKTFAFYGSMAAGKTTFIKVLCEVLGVKDVVTSPTFSLVNEYISGNGEKIFHFDFYRIRSITEAYDMGYEDYFYSNAFCFIEWPEKVEELIPLDHIVINITVQGNQRVIEFKVQD